MKHIHKLIVLFLIVLTGCATSQIGSSIPQYRVIDWTTVGYHNDSSDNLPKYNDSVFVPIPTENLTENHSNITNKILEASEKKGLTAVILQNGTYKISKPINLGIGNENILLKGSGNTEISFIGESSKASNIIRIMGNPSNWANEIKIIGYDESSNSIQISKPMEDLVVGDFIEIRVPNGSWHDSEHQKSWNPQNYLGTIVKVIKINKLQNELTLDHSLGTLWYLSQKDKLIPSFVKFTPVQEIGIESLKLSTDDNNNREGFNINIAYATNCWVKNVESAYAASAHLNIGNSTSIEVRNSTFHHAKDYGNPAIHLQKIIAGTGYGVNVARSSNCLIENNVFYHLRHAMIIALGSDRNVFGYNYSYNQFSYPVKNLSDLNLHGHFPYNNLFEGNVVERIHADQWWGSNGPNNTFVRNSVSNGSIKLEKTNGANILGNEAKLELIDSKSEFDYYGKGKSQKDWNGSDKISSDLEDISYYKKDRPSFLDDNYTWPPIGPSLKKGVNLTNKIPAQDRDRN